jgi:hypothetical protein
VESVEAEAPHIGHLRVSAGMVKMFNAKVQTVKDAKSIQQRAVPSP